jgi:hypothetical protein
MGVLSATISGPNRTVAEQIRQIGSQGSSDANKRRQGGVSASGFHTANMCRLDAVALRGFLDRPAALPALFAQSEPELNDDTTKGFRFPVVPGLPSRVGGRCHSHPRLLPQTGSLRDL